MKISIELRLFLTIFILIFSVQNAHSQNRIERLEKLRNIRNYANLGSNSELNTLNINGINRQYLLRLPNSNGSKIPLVIVLHGGGGNAVITENMTGFTQLAMHENFAIVYPNGSGHRENIFLTWNASHCCGFAMENQIDDVEFISNLIDELTKNNNIDPTRIYVTGMSNGAMMTHKIGRELSNKIAAIATDVGTLFGDEPPPKNPVPALIINGMLDNNVPYNGGTPNGIGRNAWGTNNIPPASAQAQYWARFNGCSLNPNIHDQGQIIKNIYSCPFGKEVIQVSIKDGEHSWFGGQSARARANTPSQSYNSTSEIWNFFKTHHN